MLNKTERARAYEPMDEWKDQQGTIVQAPGSRRRLTQGEMHLIDSIYEAVNCSEDHTIKALAGAVQLLMDAAPRETLSGWKPGPPSEEAVSDARSALSDPEAKVTNLYLGALQEGLKLGFLAGQREGFRLGMVTANRLQTATPANPVPLPELQGMPTAAALALLVSAMGDDSALDSLLGHLVTGRAPEFIPATREGGAQHA